LLALAGLMLVARCSLAADPISAGGPGPYNLTFLQGGVGMTRALPADAPLLKAGAPWSISGWIRSEAPQPGPVMLAAVGDPGSDRSLRLLLDAGRLVVGFPGGETLRSSAAIAAGTWQAIAVTHDGTTARVYVEGQLSGSVSVTSPGLASTIYLAPASVLATRPGVAAHFGGSLAQFQLMAGALSADHIVALASARPDFEHITSTPVGVGWAVQSKAWIGLQTPQDPWTLPQGKSPPGSAVASAPPSGNPLVPEAEHQWRLGAWRLAAAPNVKEDGAMLSRADYNDAAWYAATVPGTVLTTLIDRGVYPDPDYGLNNMVIPESLARQDYWYRTRFTPATEPGQRRYTLTFKGINYAAEVWLNGTRVGQIRGAFIRGVFDVTALIAPGRSNALAVRVSPPPHPGIPSEESIAYGPGDNGGSLALDGPTFIATEGWDWIPGVRDRDTGLWQDVELRTSGAVRILDATVITHLPLPKIDVADLQILVPVENAAALAQEITVEARFAGVSVVKRVMAAPGRSEVRLEPGEFPQLKVQQPQLWWPNGYGSAHLYPLELVVHDANGVSDRQDLRFGIRQITYELSLFDHLGLLRRVEIDPTAATARGEQLVDVRHEAIKQVPNGWAASLTPAGENSPAVHDVPTESLSPYLVIRVNGTPIAVRGGSWGMDDSRKRISRARLEPYFRLHREAHLNIIRNWLGQDTEDVFYDLADEYGLLVLNDFWESTQEFQLELQDPALFLANAADVISRYRHHPSIALWFGRNEGVPQPIVNEGLAGLIATLDGTRYYTGSSNRVNLQDSGPYNYRPPVGYFTDLARGFSVEVGTPSLATLESIKASVPEADRWPLSDTIAYHDWHFGGNGDVASFMKALDTQFGAATSLEDFERKAQMMNYVDYRAIFEGFFAHLWYSNSGRLLWMTHPSWPSNHWQIYSSDYDTQASYYGAKKAAEPLHLQMNLPDFALAVVNTTREPRTQLTARSQIVALDGKLLGERIDRLTAPANQVTTLAPLALAPWLARYGTVLVALTLSDAAGARISENLYWPSADEASARKLNEMPAQTVLLSATSSTAGEEAVIRVALRNAGSAPALAAKLTLVDGRGERILPAYYSDNYLSLLAGETRQLEIRYPGSHAGPAQLRLRGWNVKPASVTVTATPPRSVRQ
jgi:hypothetical protein